MVSFIKKCLSPNNVLKQLATVVFSKHYITGRNSAFVGDYFQQLMHLML